MLPLELQKDDIQKRLELLDDHINEVYRNDGRFQVMIVGGSALLLCDYISRSTEDIDVLEADKRLYEIMDLYNINGKVNSYIFSFLYNYENRANHIWSGKKIDFYTASLEDIVVAKICGWRKQDIKDLADIAEYIDWEILEQLINNEEELRYITMSERGYLDFKACYEIFEREHRLCKN